MQACTLLHSPLFKRPLSLACAAMKHVLHTPYFRLLYLINIGLCVSLGRGFSDRENSSYSNWLVAPLLTSASIQSHHFSAQYSIWTTELESSPGHQTFINFAFKACTITAHSSSLLFLLLLFLSIILLFFLCATTPTLLYYRTFPLCTASHFLCTTALVTTHVDRVLWWGIGYGA